MNTIDTQKTVKHNTSLDQGNGGSSHIQMPNDGLWLSSNTATSNGYIQYVYKIDGFLNAAAFKTAVHDVQKNIASIIVEGEEHAGQVVEIITEHPVFSTDDLSLDAFRSHIVNRIKKYGNKRTESIVIVDIYSQSEDITLMSLMFHSGFFDKNTINNFISQISSAYEAVCQHSEYIPKSISILVKNASIDVYSGPFWVNLKETVSQEINFPKKKNRPETRSYSYSRVEFELSPFVTDALTKLSNNMDASLEAILFSIQQILIFRYTGAENFIISVPCLSFPDRNIENAVIGNSTDYLPVIIEINGDKTISDVVDNTRQSIASVQVPGRFCLQDFFVSMELGIEEGYDRFSKIAYSLNTKYADALRITDCNVERMGFPLVFAGAPELLFEFIKTGHTIKGVINYQTELYEDTAISLMASHYANLIDSVMNSMDVSISSLNMLTTVETHQQVDTWNNTVTNYPREICIQKLFEAQADQTPHSTAVKSENEVLNYRDLNHRANQLAGYLREQGVTTGTFVAVYLNRSVEMVVSMLAILKAGGAYVPLEPSYPSERIAYMLADTNAPLMITVTSMKDQLPSIQARLICLDDVIDDIAGFDTGNMDIVSTNTDLAYVIYTSGSTGLPKGIKVPHLGVTRLVKNTNYVSIGNDDIVMQFSPVTFDASVFEIWAPLLNGAVLMLPPPGKLALDELASLFLKEEISTVLLIAPLFHAMVEKYFDSLKGINNLFAVGDVLSVEHVKKAIDGLPKTTRLINGYGPSENTTFTTCHLITEADILRNSIPIGKPIANTTTYILDPQLNLLPVGAIGELYTGGDGLAHGYLNRDDLTKNTFVPNPFSKEPNARMYKTGDLARYQSGGTIEFLGRIDHQIKIRGIRIEIGEIETTLSKHEALGEVIVVARETDDGDKLLVAYAVTNQLYDDVDNIAVFSYLKDKLPPHLLPDAIVISTKFVLTPNGKIDRKVLPMPEDGDFVNRQRFVYGVKGKLAQ